MGSSPDALLRHVSLHRHSVAVVAASRQDPFPPMRGAPVLVQVGRRPALAAVALVLLQLSRLRALQLRVNDRLISQVDLNLLPILVSNQVLPRRSLEILHPADVPPAHGWPVHLHFVSNRFLALRGVVVGGIGLRTRLREGQELEALLHQVQAHRNSALVVPDEVRPLGLRVAEDFAPGPLGILGHEYGHLPPHDLRAEHGLVVGCFALPNAVTWACLVGSLDHFHRVFLCLRHACALLQERRHDVLIPVSCFHPVHVNHVSPGENQFSMCCIRRLESSLGSRPLQCILERTVRG
mmetsp:Transcript_15591/g.39743  ORF Transcript_15591/g.39743 Transcript_15591/m.39743 type:complete len:295 (-) Transcript_15591:164-1048(-)